MKKFRTMAMLALSALTLCGCMSKTTYADFNAAAKKVESISYTKATLKGKYDKEENLNIKFIMGTTLGISAWKVDDSSMDTAAAAAWAVTFNVFAALRPAAVAESDSVEYYCGGGFKTVDGSTTTEWNAYGYLTSITNGDSKLTASWSK